MSLFLGKVHFWLYNKILWFEHLEDAIAAYADGRGIPAQSWKQEFEAAYGEATGGRPLEEIIDQSNIHGWLQERITRAESRQAAFLTRLTAQEPGKIEDLKTLFHEHGLTAGRSYEGNTGTPESLFNGLNDYILDGMPCDRVNQIVSSEPDKFEWKMMQCVHKPVWDAVDGDVSLFYDLRHEWIRGFVTGASDQYAYGADNDNMRWIERKRA
ncbi:hypothetical protein [Acidaminobacter hydrogenoformans]|uniref:Uncharacterized protein n=1 Tax=Acidaminobacter hydrogenoformans DSM 2784 TaxID=1120920 RepID=A0A1G5S666_9FIRM|nr:hypothetical protein [Acidaminobacter hydrogenoformans]SCZ81698.1 hypothetical protein SAMN03080599_02950 [Acidaminobacter hydrogenoformans DSM 2784]